MDDYNDIEVKIGLLQQELVEPASMLFAAQQIAGKRVDEQTKKAYGRLTDAHLLITGVLGAALLSTNGKFVENVPTSEERNAIFASFVIGLNTCEEAIATGAYLQACALLRQEMESVAQLKAIKEGKRRHKKSPNIRLLEKSIARLYGQLSEAAHLTTHHLVRAVTALDLTEMAELPGPTSGTRYFSVFDESLARRLFALHLTLILHVIEELNLDFSKQHKSDIFTERDFEAINSAVYLMQIEGLIEVDVM